MPMDMEEKRERGKEQDLKGQEHSIDRNCSIKALMRSRPCLAR